MEHIVIFRDKSVYASHASACQAVNGDVLVAFRQAPFEHIFAHVHPRATVGLIISRDGGMTWDIAGKRTILDPGDGMNLNDPSLTTLRDGTIILTAFITPAPWAKDKDRWGERALPVRGNDYFYVPDERKILLRRSFDNGLTWDGPFIVDTSPYGDCGAGVFASVMELSDGTLLMPITAGSSKTGIHTAALIASRDKGESWEPYSVITTWGKEEGSAQGFGLPSVVAYDDLHLFAVGWCVQEHGTLVTESLDGGKTWTPTRPINTRGACMHLCVTRNGTTLMSYGYRLPPFGIRVWPSYDQGKTWNPADAAVLRSDGAMRDLGYPWTIQLSDGRLLTVYYFNVEDEDKSYYDEEKALEICRAWNLDPLLYTYQKAGLRFIGGTLYTEEELKSLAGTGLIESETVEAGPTLL